MHLQTDEVFIYPVKSVGPVKTDTIALGDKGLLYDRHWMLIHEDGRMITQREFPVLNKIQCSDLHWGFCLSLEGGSFGAIEFNKEDDVGDEIQIAIWKDVCTVRKTQAQLSQWFSDLLSVKVFVVTNPDRKKVLTGQSHLSRLNFQDSGPVHLVNLSSVSDLSSRCQYEINPMQFRANIYLDLGEAYIEDQIKEITINGISFRYVKSCMRCIMINLKTLDDAFQKDPLKCLSEFRKTDHSVSFGIYLSPE